ncbi:mucin-like glycoprotein [Trypanosoma rangeli]|uniref:Mucin-like glycoprotein n=1 Tax=Trypanosoma rangeli TaxID=5698 RepID=A0A422MRN0_TRYRA|nr:mucin-like glycoprotein [Trypanosoma rangeli]RNE95857.1 mucin-like glycoprotein [Trypanosoma rangeli]|eukprot:RNE95857.1 mucin-like glycoprotein [Trypanosoma rangeli]
MAMEMTARCRAVSALAVLVFLCGFGCSPVCGATPDKKGSLKYPPKECNVVVPLEVSCGGTDGIPNFRFPGDSDTWTDCSSLRNKVGLPDDPVLVTEYIEMGFCIDGPDVHFCADHTHTLLPCFAASSIYASNNCEASCAGKDANSTVAFTMNFWTYEDSEPHHIWKNITTVGKDRGQNAQGGVCSLPPPSKKAGGKHAVVTGENPSAAGGSGEQTEGVPHPSTTERHGTSSGDAQSLDSENAVPSTVSQGPTPKATTDSSVTARKGKKDTPASVDAKDGASTTETGIAAPASGSAVNVTAPPAGKGTESTADNSATTTPFVSTHLLLLLLLLVAAVACAAG